MSLMDIVEWVYYLSIAAIGTVLGMFGLVHLAPRPTWDFFTAITGAGIVLLLLLLTFLFNDIFPRPSEESSMAGRKGKVSVNDGPGSEGKKPGRRDRYEMIKVGELGIS